MIILDVCIDRCFAQVEEGCTLLTDMADECNYKCPFYKPVGCKDWVRMKHDGQDVICPPEEYERRFKSEEDTETSAVHWRIKVLPKG